MEHEKDELKSFDPTDPAFRRKLWVRVVTPDGAYHHFFWRRILLGGVFAGLVGWLALASGLWGFLKFRRDWREVRLTDVVLLPLRYDEFRSALADHYIAMGQKEVEAKNYRYAYTLFMSGL